jgi:hypothetical protein
MIEHPPAENSPEAFERIAELCRRKNPNWLSGAERAELAAEAAERHAAGVRRGGLLGGKPRRAHEEPAEA